MSDTTSHPATKMQRCTTALFTAAVLQLATIATTLAAEAKPERPPEQSPRRWELEIVQGALLIPDANDIPATLRSVTDYLVELHPANVVLAPTLGNVEIGNLKLAGFRWDTALEALRIASGNQFTWSLRPQAGGVDPTTGLPMPSADVDPVALYVLEPDPTYAQRSAGGVVEVFNLAGYLRGMQPEEVPEGLKELEGILAQSLDQVRARGSVAESEPAPSIRFHEGAKLLVVVGSAEQVDLARKIILALPGTVSSHADAASGYGARYGSGGGVGGMGVGGSSFGGFGGGIGGGGAMGGGGGVGGGSFGGAGMEETMMMRYGIRSQKPPGSSTAGGATGEAKSGPATTVVPGTQRY